VSIESICAACSTSRSTIYSHFPDGRDGVLRAAYQQAGEGLVTLARDRARSITGWDARIASYARTMLEFSSSPNIGSFYSISGPHVMGFQAKRGTGAQSYFDDIRDELTTAHAAGDLPHEADPAMLATLLTSSLRDAGIAAADSPELCERLVDSIWTILHGLRALSVHAADVPELGRGR
jgi:AcrR family transcriptional regulator